MNKWDGGGGLMGIPLTITEKSFADHCLKGAFWVNVIINDE